MKIKFNKVYNDPKTLVICDTNVWYGFNQGTPTIISDEFTLTPTFLTLVELGTSEVMVHDLKLFQNTIKSVYENGGPIIPLNPVDYVLSQQLPDYPIIDGGIKKLLKDFSYILSLDINDETKIDDELKREILISCKTDRKATVDFAEYGNSKIDEIRKNINLGIGRKQHIKIDTSKTNQEMIKSIFNEHAKEREYTIDWDRFNWNKIDLFMKVTESFFKKVETTKGMKIKPNDAIDWLNMLYVSPVDKYLTLEDPWRTYIEQDDRIKQYLFQ